MSLTGSGGLAQRSTDLVSYSHLPPRSLVSEVAARRGKDWYDHEIDYM